MRSYRSPRAICAALAVVLGVALPAIVHALPRAAISIPRGPYVPNQVIVRLQHGSPVDLALAGVPGAKALGTIDDLDVSLLSVPSVDAALRVLRTTPGVTSAEPNYLGTVAAVPPPSRANDPLFAAASWDARQWYMQRLNALYAWTIYPRAYYTARQRPTNALKIAVLDTAIDTQHRDWRNSGGDSSSVTQGGQLDLREAKSFIDPRKVDGPNLWHGTFVAGLIGAAADNQQDIAGIAYAAQIMPVTVAWGDGTVNAYDLANGITWATNHGARVINVSIAITAPNAKGVDAVRAATLRAVSKGSLIVAAIGNDKRDDAKYPAGFALESSGVLAVGASDAFDKQDVLCSSGGRLVSVVAPDQLIWSLLPQSNSSAPATVRATCQTSFSAAIVSGVAALVAGRYPSSSPGDIAKRIEQGTDDIAPAGRDDYTGWGRVNAEKALWPGGGPRTAWTSLPVGGPTGRITLTAAVSKAASGGEILIDGGSRGRGYQPRAYTARGARYVSQAVDTSKMSEGMHEVSVRARDANGTWGPASTGVFVVDRSPPEAQKGECYSADATRQNIAFPDDIRQELRFQIYDKWSPAMNVKIDLIDATFTSRVTIRYKGLPSGLYDNLKWSAVEAAAGGPVTPGPYRIIMNVTDQAGMSSYSDTPCTVLPSIRMIPSPGASSSGPLPGVSTHLPTATPAPVAQTPTPNTSVPGTITPATFPLPTGTPT